jgi:outer membrane protein TolC
MRTIQSLYLAFFILSCGAVSLSAQPVIPEDNPETDEELILPPLALLLDSAVHCSPMVKVREYELAAKTSGLTSLKNSWIKNIGFQADMRYGTFDILTNTATDGQSPYLYSARSNQLNYGVGAFVRFPIYDLVNHRNMVNQAEAEQASASSLADAQREELRKMVITQYYDVLLKHKLLKIKAKNLSTSRINMDMAENEFRNGQLIVSEYARIAEIVGGAEAEFESAKSDFTTSFLILEEIVGFKIDTNLSKAKNEAN